MYAFRKWSFRFLILCLWLASSVPVGGFILSVKETWGINIFSNTGYHAFKSCLAHEATTALKDVKH